MFRILQCLSGPQCLAISSSYVPSSSLFRSLDAVHVRHLVIGDDHTGQLAAHQFEGLFSVAGLDDGEAFGAGLLADDQADRKRTRLNSSHVSISYAVCW